MTFRALVLSAFAGPVAATVLACGDPSTALPAAEEPRAVASESAPASDAAAARFEVRFMTGMIDHHMMAVMMAEACLTRAVHAELIATCEQIIAVQGAEIALLQGWLADWYGITHEPEMTPGAARQMERLMALEGEAFELAFLEGMIRHHLGAVREGDRCLDRAAHPELLALCEGIVTSQTAEVEMMAAWRCDWYGRCHGPGGHASE